MNYQKYFKSAALINNPLCGINTYKDIINLSTGQITRDIKKLILTGNEVVYVYANSDIAFRINTSDALLNNRYCVCTHFVYQQSPGSSNIDGITAGAGDYNLYFTFSLSSAAKFGIVAGDTNSFKSFLQQQFSAGTPVTVWYVLTTPETKQITVPSGMTGTVEGYLTQTGTPTPTDPIYPVANDAVGWYALKNYVRNTTWQDGSTYSRSGGSWSSATAAKKRSLKKK